MAYPTSMLKDEAVLQPHEPAVVASYASSNVIDITGVPVGTLAMAFHEFANGKMHDNEVSFIVAAINGGWSRRTLDASYEVSMKQFKEAGIEDTPYFITDCGCSSMRVFEESAGSGYITHYNQMGFLWSRADGQGHESIHPRYTFEGFFSFVTRTVVVHDFSYREADNHFIKRDLTNNKFTREQLPESICSLMMATALNIQKKEIAKWSGQNTN